MREIAVAWMEVVLLEMASLVMVAVTKTVPVEVA